MMKVKVRWSGFIGSPGWSNFYFDTLDDSFHTPDDGPIVHGKVHTFFDAIKIRLPGVVQLAVQPDVEVIDPVNGKLLNVYNGGVRPTLTGGQPTTATFSASSGMVITWRTAGVRNGRRVRGRTFIVPLAGGAYGPDGTIGNGDVTETVNAATTLAAPLSGMGLGVWSRPSAVGAEDGEFHPITSVSVPDMAAVLRSRRG